MNVLLLTAFLLPVAMAFAVLRRVPEGQAWTVHRFGRYARTLQPGVHAVWPAVDRIGSHVPLIGHRIELPARAFGASVGNADLYYQILDPLPTGQGLESVDEMVQHQADDALASVAANLPQQVAETATMADALKAELNRRLGRMGLRVIRCALHAG
jgi:regulator of protease activity HflC (stomatin/prohibitin superfamily)